MKVLVIGSGGREHTLVWKIASSPRVEKIYCAPGNGGISELAECVCLEADDISGLKSFAREKEIDLTVVGPEAPLVAGIVDEFERSGLKIFGPGRELARLEGSKVFAKETMAKLKIPTAKFEVFDQSSEALKFVEKGTSSVVIKADGLAAGKGVIIARDRTEARQAVKLIMEEKKFGSAGDRIVVEECLLGEEASIIVFSDGKKALSLASSQDHKRIGTGDTGPNTGGMGAYSPAPGIDRGMERRVMEEIIEPLISGLAAEGKFYRGVLYAGIMVTAEGPRVLEFNVRFGDPETQAIFPRLKSDLVEVMERVIDGNLEGVELSWDERACVCVVLASGGYPGKYQAGFPITGLSQAGRMPGVAVFHAGTRRENLEFPPKAGPQPEAGPPRAEPPAERTENSDRRGRYVTSGGRVLGVTALGEDIARAVSQAYEAVNRIYFEGMYFRSDIGYRALSR